ncbi:putative 3-demethylubiquinone-9 3-methyltransferase (glyoxalase superfamily) [Rhizomicrobium palustre]|uniref:Putative 3-demethylubiquinone-9 3-methyltransferase (Glyoxalase superfamily) n=1 Tax=Rhizomicrobium palustre TaxID=189966 RepID=A0A846MVR4_9PROT|nr:VOC family protein [Rhizomicrobium palustre]NIK87648.1 putative 3-demethylubiquinone-9 3-methyltransferase (glyoxalase superfamily) [Rhizomicrobium palustre]
MPKITPFLWFDTEAEEAARYYTAIFPNSKITEITHYGEGGPRPKGMVMTVVFELDGKPFVALNGGPQYSFTNAVSLLVDCADQKEIDYYWEKLTAGGKEIACGWLSDKYGLPWQIAPKDFGRFFPKDNPAKANAAMQAMMGMVKIDLAAMQKAFDEA